MKKLLAFAMVTVMGLQLVAQEASNDDGAAAARDERKPQESSVWPAFIAISEFPNSPDVVGLRLTIPFSTKQENVTGFDLGLWGRAQYFEGFQLNILRNEARDTCAGFQIGLYNTMGRGDMFALQVGLWNEAQSILGAQVGLVNTAGEAKGFQIGLINRSETMTGYQVGLVNIIRSAELQFLPVINIGF